MDKLLELLNQSTEEELLRMIKEQNISVPRFISRVESSREKFNSKIDSLLMELRNDADAYVKGQPLECVRPFKSLFKIGDKITVTDVREDSVVIEDIFSLKRELVHIYFKVVGE
jgi:hypothetical protein